MTAAPAPARVGTPIRERLRWLVPAAVVVGIFAVTSLPHPPAMPNNSDKLVHLSAYGALGVTVAWAARLHVIRSILPYAVAISCLGAVDEWHQKFIPNRSMDVRDWIADTVGAVAGLLLVTASARRREPVA